MHHSNHAQFHLPLCELYTVCYIYQFEKKSGRIKKAPEGAFHKFWGIISQYLFIIPQNAILLYKFGEL